jgi:hypothetical protein
MPADSAAQQQMFLAALHCHCMQLLAQARDQLPPATCSLGHSAGSSRSSNDSASGQQQLLLQAWQQCLQQVQHNLLLVLKLTKHWQQLNGSGQFEELLMRKL